MSWSDDTRCLYCEGRLPLYRKITHGQFCSSAHRKSYWQEQERLAVERLHQSHDSLRSHRTIGQVDAKEDARGTLATHPALQPLLDAGAAVSDLDPILVSPVFAPEEIPLTMRDLVGALTPGFLPKGPQLPALVAADPFEYEIACQPLPPAHPWRVPEPNPLPEGRRLAAWTILAPQFWTSPATQPALNAVEDGFESHIMRPRSAQSPARGLRTGGRVAWPLKLSANARLTPVPLVSEIESSLQALAIAIAPVTEVVFEVQPQSDVLIELLDQQVPRPDQLYALCRFAAQESRLALSRSGILFEAELDAPVPTTWPASALAAVAPGYELSATGMVPLSASILALQGDVVSAAAHSEIPANSRVEMFSLPIAAEEPTWQVAAAGLQSLASNLPQPTPGTFALQQAGSLTFDLSPRGSAELSHPKMTASSTAPPWLTFESTTQGGTAGLISLPSHLLQPAQGAFTLPTAGVLALDLSTGVSSDITFPDFVPGASITGWAPRLTGILPLTFAKKRKAEAPKPEPIARLIPQAVESHPVLPNSGLEPMDRKPAADALRAKGSGIGAMLHGEGLKALVPAWAHATGFWQHAPRDLKLLLFAIPALLALVFHPGLPRVAFAAPQSSSGYAGNFKRVLNDQWSNVRQTLESRAAIALDEDFRAGLDNWASPSGSTTEWSFDSTGFVKPGPLALYRPSVNLADYQAQFMGTIDKKALSWVVRAADFENFYVVKLVVLKAGPLPTIGVTRYAVIQGKAQDRHDVTIPLSARSDTLYRVRMDVQGSNFSLDVQGQMADSWTETRLPRGGVGFFTARGEESRVRWVQITHQYDMLGRLCAYLAPYDTSNGSWQP